MLCLLTCVPLSQKNSVDGQKLTPTLGSPNATKTNPPKKNSPAGWQEGLRVALCVVSALPLLLPQKQTHPKKNSPSEWRDEFRVAVNRRMTRWMNWPSGWMDDYTDLREASLFGFSICRHPSFTICNSRSIKNFKTFVSN